MKKYVFILLAFALALTVSPPQVVASDNPNTEYSIVEDALTGTVTVTELTYSKEYSPGHAGLTILSTTEAKQSISIGDAELPLTKLYRAKYDRVSLAKSNLIIKDTNKLSRKNQVTIKPPRTNFNF